MFLTRMDSLTFLPSTYIWEALVARLMVSCQCGLFHVSSSNYLRNWISCHIFTAEWFLTNMDSLMSLETTSPGAFEITLSTAEWFFTSVDSFIYLPISWLPEILVTLWASKWFLTSVDSFMTVQFTFCGKCFAAFGATQLSFKSGALISPLHTFDSELPQNCTLNLHKILSCFWFHGQFLTDGFGD